jgi:hypothetical protein
MAAALFADLRHYPVLLDMPDTAAIQVCISTTSSCCNLAPSRIALDLAAPRPDDVQRRRRTVLPLAALSKIWPVLMSNLIGWRPQKIADVPFSHFQACASDCSSRSA